MYIVSHISVADWSATGYLGSDYLFNGVSQTNQKPTLHLSIDYSAETGLYAGVKGLNIEFSDGSDLEIDSYLGFYHELNENNALDFGIAQYSYTGGSSSSKNNFQEAYFSLDIGNTSFNYWYAWDYFGTDARHYVAMLNHTIIINEQLSLLVGVDKSESLDPDRFSWEFQDENYIHHQATLHFSYQNFDLSLGFHHTDLDSLGDSVFLFSIARKLDF